MNEKTNDILLAVTGTVTINTDEYRDLMERNAYLNFLMALSFSDRSYILNDAICIVSDLLKGKSVTNDCPEDGSPEGVGDNA